ncbi:MAG: hypothetical protein ABIA63_06495, partial [bacterium]
MIRIYSICIFFTLFLKQALPSAIDTTPPGGTWISPEYLSIITTNSIRVAVDAKDNKGGSCIKKVVFYASYCDNNGRNVSKYKIGEIYRYP